MRLSSGAKEMNHTLIAALSLASLSVLLLTIDHYHANPLRWQHRKNWIRHWFLYTSIPYCLVSSFVTVAFVSWVLYALGEML